MYDVDSALLTFSRGRVGQGSKKRKVVSTKSRIKALAGIDASRTGGDISWIDSDISGELVAIYGDNPVGDITGGDHSEISLF